jgi:hypothetical protein
LIKPIFLKNGDKICLEIDNPYLIDHLRYRLKELKHITDSSFSPELVQLTTDAFVDIFDFYIPEKSKDDIKEAFIQLGAESDKSFRGILKGVFKRIGARFAAEAGGAVAEDIGELLSPLLTNGISAIFERLAFVFQEKS